MTTIVRSHGTPVQRIIQKEPARDPEIIKLNHINAELLPAVKSDLTLSEKHDRNFPYGYITVFNKTGGGQKLALHTIDLIRFRDIIIEAKHGIVDNNYKFSKEEELDLAAVSEHQSIAKKVFIKNNPMFSGINQSISPVSAGNPAPAIMEGAKPIYTFWPNCSGTYYVGTTDAVSSIVYTNSAVKLTF